MRSLVATALFLFAGYIAIMADMTPAPRKLAAKAQTEESIKEEMNREQKQKQYAVAAKTALIVFKHHAQCNSLADIIGERAVESRLPARVLAAMAIAESGCNPEAVSATGDYGVWQVNAKIWRINSSVLKDPIKNAAVAAHILQFYVKHYGLVEGLHHYNGMGRPAGEYSGAILMIAYGRTS